MPSRRVHEICRPESECRLFKWRTKLFSQEKCSRCCRHPLHPSFCLWHKDILSFMFPPHATTPLRRWVRYTASSRLSTLWFCDKLSSSINSLGLPAVLPEARFILALARQSTHCILAQSWIWPSDIFAVLAHSTWPLSEDACALAYSLLNMQWLQEYSLSLSLYLCHSHPFGKKRLWRRR